VVSGWQRATAHPAPGSGACSIECELQMGGFLLGNVDSLAFFVSYQLTLLGLLPMKTEPDELARSVRRF